MGNLILVVVITFLLKDSFGQTVNLSKDKRSDKKSIEVLIESDGVNPDTKDSEINRLVINSTYHDSVFISTYLKKGVNVTVVQDNKSVVDVKKQNAMIDDEVSMLESKANELMTNNTITSSVLLKKLSQLFYKVVDTRKQETDEDSRVKLFNLSESLRSKYRIEYEKKTKVQLTKMITILQNVIGAKNIEKPDLDQYDGIVVHVLRLVPKTTDLGLRNFCRRVVDEFQKFVAPLRMQINIDSKINEMRRTLRQQYYNSRNASIVENNIAELNQLQPTNEYQKNAVNSLKREAVDLMEAVNLIATVKTVLRSNPENVDTNEMENSVRNVAKSSINRSFRRVANRLVPQLERRKNNQGSGLKEKRNWMKILRAINQTLESHQGFGGKAGLQIIEQKLKGIIGIAKDDHVKAKARRLVQSVKHYEKDIDIILETFERIDKEGHVPKSNAEVKQYETSIDEIRKLTTSVDDAKVSIRSQELINKIQKAIQGYQMHKQINNINMVLKNMNNSLEKAETSDDIKKEVRRLNLLETVVQRKNRSRESLNQTLNQIDSMKRKIPAKFKEIVLKREAHELLKIVNVYHQNVLPVMKDKIKKVASRYEDLRKIDDKDFDTDVLKNRTRIASEDFDRTWRDLKAVRNALKDFHFTSEESQEVEDFTSTFGMLNKIFKLKQLFRNQGTGGITNKMITIVQNVDHVSNMLEQLEKMIKFSTWLLLTSKRTEESTELPYNATKIPSIKKVSLIPLVIESKAIDLNKTVHGGPAKNTSTINADEDDVE